MPETPMPPEVVAFDGLDTLFSLASLAPPVTAAGGDESTVDRWLERLRSDGFALTAAGEYRPFLEVAKATLRAVLPGSKAPARNRVVAGLGRLEAHPDSAGAMGRSVISARVIVVTNTSAELAGKLLAHGRLDAFVDAVVSADDVRTWKPAAAPYAHAAVSQGVPPERMAMVTVHGWDVMGARRAGLVTGWCRRDGAQFPAHFGQADVTGANLVEVVDRLFALKGGPGG